MVGVGRDDLVPAVAAVLLDESRLPPLVVVDHLLVERRLAAGRLEHAGGVRELVAAERYGRPAAATGLRGRGDGVARAGHVAGGVARLDRVRVAGRCCATGVRVRRTGARRRDLRAVAGDDVAGDADGVRGRVPGQRHAARGRPGRGEAARRTRWRGVVRAAAGGAVDLEVPERVAVRRTAGGPVDADVPAAARHGQVVDRAVAGRGRVDVGPGRAVG